MCLHDRVEIMSPAVRNCRCGRARLTAEGPSDVGDVFGEPKVGDLDVTVGAEEDVFRFQVAVDDVKRVEVVERERDFGSKELGDGVRESLWAGSRAVSCANGSVFSIRSRARGASPDSCEEGKRVRRQRQSP